MFSYLILFARGLCVFHGVFRGNFHHLPEKTQQFLIHQNAIFETSEATAKPWLSWLAGRDAGQVTSPKSRDITVVGTFESYLPWN